MQTVKLIKLSACPCGFPAMKPGIELGTEYQVDPEDQEDFTLICGGCKESQHKRCVFARSRSGGAPGYLPVELFDMGAPEPEVFVPLEIDTAEIEAGIKGKRLFIGKLGRNMVFGIRWVGGELKVGITGRDGNGTVMVSLSNLKTLVAMLEGEK